MKKQIAILTVAAMLGAQSVAMAIANPITEYATYAEAQKALGFSPLYLPRISGCDLYYVSVIGGTVADLSYRRAGNYDSEIRVRTAKKTADQKEDISGVYSTNRAVHTLHDIPVEVCKLSDKIYSANWQQGDYLFSVQTEGISYTDFMNVLVNGVVDLSVHYYADDNQSEKQDDKK